MTLTSALSPIFFRNDLPFGDANTNGMKKGFQVTVEFIYYEWDGIELETRHSFELFTNFCIIKIYDMQKLIAPHGITLQCT